MKKEEILNIANEAYPKIVKYFGQTELPVPKIEVYRNIYVRLTGEEDAEGEETPNAEYDRKNNEMLLFSDYIEDKEQLIRALVHEYQHYLQDGEEFKRLYDKGHTYQNHPFELDAIRNEELWYKFV